MWCSWANCITNLYLNVYVHAQSYQQRVQIHVFWCFFLMLPPFQLSSNCREFLQHYEWRLKTVFGEKYQISFTSSLCTTITWLAQYMENNDPIFKSKKGGRRKWNAIVSLQRLWVKALPPLFKNGTRGHFWKASGCFSHLERLPCSKRFPSHLSS